MILLPLNARSDYPGRSGPCRGGGGGWGREEEGQSWRERERLRWEGGVEAAFVLSPWLFPLSSWLQDGYLEDAGRRTTQEAFMGCTIYAASPKALPAEEAPGQDAPYQPRQRRHPHGACSQRIAASRAR